MFEDDDIASLSNQLIAAPAPTLWDNELIDDATAQEIDAAAAEEAGLNPEERTYTNVYGQSGDWDKGAGDLIYADHDHYNQNVTEAATVDDLQSLYDSNTDMQKMFGSFDTYLSYMDERQDLIDSGVPVDFIGALGEQAAAGAEDQAASAQLQNLVLIEAQGNTLTSEQAAQKAELEAAGVVPSLGMPTQISGGGESVTTSIEAYEAMMANEQMAELNAKYGIPTGAYQNERGDTVMWTGSGQIVHTPLNKSFAHDVVGPALFAIAAGVIAAPIANSLAGALTNAGLSPTLASAASNAIMNSAAQLATTGDIDFTQALMSAAGAYFQDNGLGGLTGNGEISEALNGMSEAVTGKLDEFQELISTGSTVADAAIQAGGMSMLTSLVVEGEVDAKQALIAAAMAGGTAGMNELAASGAVTESEMDEFEEWMQEDDEIQQQFIDADVKDPFLNPNYTEVGDGLMQNAEGVVYNYGGDEIGNMSDLDVDGDGLLNSNDLEFVEATGEYIPMQGAGPQQGQLTYSEQNNYFTEDGQPYDGRVTFNGDNYVGADGQIVTHYTDAILNDQGQLQAYFEKGEWFRGDGSLITEPSVIDELTRLADPSGTMDAVQVYDQNGNLISFGNSPLSDNYEDGQFLGSVFGKDGQRYELGADGIMRPTGEFADPSAVSDYWYDPVHNVMYANEENTIVNEVDLAEPEQTTDTEQASDPVDSTDETLTGGDSGAGDNGSPNENEYIENTIIDADVNDSTEDSTVINPFLNNNDSASPEEVEVYEEQLASEQEEATPEEVEAYEEQLAAEQEESNSEIVDSNGEVAVDTGSSNSSNPTYRTDQLAGLLGGMFGSLSGQGGTSTDTGTEDGSEDGDGDDPDGTTIGEDSNDGTGGDNSTELGSGDDVVGSGDPGIGDGAGGDGEGEGGGLGQQFTPVDFDPQGLFKYTGFNVYKPKARPAKVDYLKGKGLLKS